MTLEEAIKHAEAAAIENEKEAKRKREHGGWYYDSEARACAICAEENRQLADWLRELQERRKQPEIIRCGECKFFRANMRPDGYIPKGVFEFECKHWNGSCDPADFCSRAKRRTDE